MLYKQCNCCRRKKPHAEYSKRTASSDGLQPRCKDCSADIQKQNYEKDKRRNAWLKRAYGLTLKDYEYMYSQQGGLCKICNRHFPQLVVDHNHHTGDIRGLLCDKCNRGLGYFDDSIEFINNASEYLEETSSYHGLEVIHVYDRRQFE